MSQWGAETGQASSGRTSSRGNIISTLQKIKMTISAECKKEVNVGRDAHKSDMTEAAINKCISWIRKQWNKSYGSIFTLFNQTIDLT